MSKNERTEEYFNNSKKSTPRETHKFININGQGVEYDEEGYLVFSGHYLDGKRSGNKRILKKKNEAQNQSHGRNGKEYCLW